MPPDVGNSFEASTVMIEGYKVMGAMLTLKSFTVNDLSEFSGVKPNTVRTILNRERQYLEKLDANQVAADNTGRPGGKYVHYVVKPEQLKHLRNKIENLRKQLPPPPEAASPDGSELTPETGENEVAVDEPPDLLLAEDALIRLFPESVSLKDKKHLITLANYHADAARVRIEKRLGGDYSEYENRQGLVLRARLRGVETLRRFSEAELRSLFGGEDQYVNIVKLREEIAGVTAELNDLGQHQLAMGVAQRALRSEIFDNPAALEPVEPVPSVQQFPKAPRVESAAAATAAAETDVIRPILSQIEEISRMTDALRRQACVNAAQVGRARFNPNENLIAWIVLRINERTQFRLSKIDVAALATEPEFYYGTTFCPGHEGWWFESLSYIQTIMAFKESGPPIGAIARNVLAQAKQT